MKSEEIKNLFEEFEPNISIKAKDLAAEMTSVNIQQKDLHGMTSIEREHIDNNKAVRDMLLSRGIVLHNFPQARA